VDPVTRQDFWQLIIRLVSAANHDHDGVAVMVSTPYMDEAARCSRVGFMRDGRLLLEGTPAELRLRLEERILELRGHPLSLLRRISEVDQDVEDAQMFGDRIHLRASPGKTAEVEARLRQRIPAEGGQIILLRTVPPQLEDVFISLLEL
jgi:ABC-2 type transport system ATP-binding protein